jgi:hypothetical protein
MSPRKARAQWLDGDCPEGVLAIFDNNGRSFDRYTILYAPESGADWLNYLAASAHPYDPQGFGQIGEMGLYEAREYRYRAAASRESAKWSSLPEDVQNCVRNDLREIAALPR